MALARSRRERGIDYWPGFVDALSTLILAITALFLVPVLISTAIAWRQWRRATAAGPAAAVGDGRPADAGHRPEGGPASEGASSDGDRTLAFVGVVLGLLFLASILAVGLPALALDPC